MQPTKELAEAVESGRFDRAMRMSPEEKFFAGGELFEFACELTLAGIREQHPGISSEDALEILRSRIQKSKRFEERPR